MLLFSPNTFIFSTSKNSTIKTYKTIILPDVLYGCETWSRTLREEPSPTIIANMDLYANIWAQEK